MQKETDNLYKQASFKKSEFENELERLKNEHEVEVRELENQLSDKRDELDKHRVEKAKVLQRCEKLEAKLLTAQSSDGSKPQVQIRTSSLVDKLKASNAIA